MYDDCLDTQFINRTFNYMLTLVSQKATLQDVTIQDTIAQQRVNASNPAN